MGTAILRNKWLRLIVDAAVLGCALFGLGMNLFQSGGFHLDMFAYFTSLSCLLTAVLYVFQLWEDVRAVRGLPYRAFIRLYLLDLVCLLVTFTFAVTMILPNYLMYGSGIGYIGEVMVYYVVPLLALIRWCLLAPHGGIHWSHPLFCGLIPVGYFLYTLLLAGLGATYEGGSVSHYPYYLLDPEKYGLLDVLSNIGFLILCCLVLGYLLFGLDRLLWLPVRGRVAQEKQQRLRKRRIPTQSELRAASRAESATKGRK